MQITTATPQQIDEALAALYYATFDLEKRVASAMATVRRALGHKATTYGRGAYRVTEWPCTDAEAVTTLRDKGEAYMGMGQYAHEIVAKYDAAVAALEANHAEQRPMHAEFTRRGGWNRFYYVDGGHLHRSMNCSTCNRGKDRTRFAWITEMSGRVEAEAIAELAEKAHTLCTVCFPSAPVVKAAPAPVKTAAEKAAEAAEKARQARINDEKAIATPEGEVLKVGGDTLKTVRSAEIKAVDALVWAAYSLHNGNGDAGAARHEAHTAQIVAALAHKRGTTAEAELAAIVAKATKKIKRELGAEVAAMAAARWAEQAEAARGPVHERIDPTAEVVCGEPDAKRLTVIKADVTCPACIAGGQAAVGPAPAPAPAADVDEAPAGPVRASYRDHGKPAAGLFHGAGKAPTAQGVPVSLEQVGMGLAIRDEATGTVLHHTGISGKFWLAPAGEQAPTAAELEAAHVEALLEQPMQRTPMDDNPEYRIPQNVLDTDARLAAEDRARRERADLERRAGAGDAEALIALGIPMHTPADDEPTPFDRLNAAEQHAAVAGKVFARTFLPEGTVADLDTRYRMRVARVGHRVLDVYDEAGRLMGQAAEQPGASSSAAWAFTFPGDVEPGLYSDRFKYLLEYARQAAARRQETADQARDGGSGGVSPVVVVGAVEAAPAPAVAGVGAVAPACEVLPDVPAVPPEVTPALVRR